MLLGFLVKSVLVGLALGSQLHSHHAHHHHHHLQKHHSTQEAVADLVETPGAAHSAGDLNRVIPRAILEENRGVFAHFMVENARTWFADTWEVDISLAKAAHLDAFALNFAASLTDLRPLQTAFAVAEKLGFSLFFSFDYAGAGPFEKDVVIDIIGQFQSSPAYYTYKGKPLVSTFEGPGNAADWKDIKAKTNCFFIPSWSSLGAKEALKLGTPDGLFSWAAWPWGNQDMDTYVDASYLDYLDQAGGKAYMMPVSPWFYTNLPGYDKNWIWRGDDLWRDRWEEVMVVQPDFVQIISWNDYGESHYIGPLHDIDNYEAFSVGKAPFNYAKGMKHDGWRLFLPYYIDTYKYGRASISHEGVVGWYRPNPAAACDDGGTTGNTASQLQYEFQPTEVAQDKIFYSALLTSLATVTVTVGGVSIPATWQDIPDGGVGVYHGSVGYGAGFYGEVKIAISRSGSTIAEFTSPPITTSCPEGYTNWNAVVGGASGPSISALSPKLAISDQTCIEGTAPGNFQGLCEFTCKYGYCPIGACVCTKLGAPRVKPKATGNKGYPIAGEGSSYIGLCNFACNYGYCPPEACGGVEVALTEPTVSPFLPSACTSGAGQGDLVGLCSYACNYGFCPIHACTCTSTGALNQPPAANTTFTAVYKGDGDDGGLCKFACQRGYCPDSCASTEGEILVCSDDDDDIEPGCEDNSPPPCDLSRTFTSLDALAAAKDIPDVCISMYTMQVLMDMLDTALANYTDVNNGYDEKFDYYVKYLRDMVPGAINTVIADHGKYVQCAELTNDGFKDPEPCFIYLTSDVWTVKYTFVNETGFYDELQAQYGIQRDWVEVSDVVNKDDHDCRPNFGKADSVQCHHINQKDKDIPHMNASFVVPNPKDSIAGALPRFRDLQLDVAATWGDLSFFLWEGNDTDAVEALSTPIFMLMQSVDSMAQIKAIGEKEKEKEEEERRNFILMIISAVLLVLPFAGEIVGTVTGIGWVADAALLADVSANLALAGYDIVKDPKSAPMELLNILFAGGGRTAANFGRAASVRRGIKAGDLAKFGDVFKLNDDLVQKLIKKVC
ncbi:glycoside hydrolase family 71 protein [Aspergillus mulundensis]|uniref:Glycosyl hydrolase family 71-domain-containing protein n=1 Tax=Aspergillus mulundensis TaxID=1810919 RepID=A0A3D8T6N7_9EURO|nr:Uncharacterized protein DSM5745_01010 [Aspergillus mulundensis]RDW93688.1 Uncharacterized protein DSM5745_01010 [Aspergillus mulundensis]